MDSYFGEPNTKARQSEIGPNGHLILVGNNSEKIEESAHGRRQGTAVIRSERLVSVCHHSGYLPASSQTGEKLAPL